MKVSTRTFLLGGSLMLVVLIAVVSPWASSEPDGLEKVAIENGFDDDAEEHPASNGPLAGYGVKGVENEGIGTVLSGLIGVAVVFLLTAGCLYLLKLGRRQPKDRA
jgi:hypothetical protein